jgi:hypothetical protein
MSLFPSAPLRRFESLAVTSRPLQPQIQIRKAGTQERRRNALSLSLFETRSLPALARRYPSRLDLLSRKSLSSIPLFLIQQSCRSFVLRHFQNTRDIRAIRGFSGPPFVPIRVHSWLMPENLKKFSLNPVEGIK